MADRDWIRMFKDKFLTEAESKFAPLADLSDKHNYCRHSFTEYDGSVSEVVRLNVWDDRHREDIIGFHFAQQYAKVYYGEQHEQPQFYVIGRDEPWDFEYVMHDGTNFFVEICRVADKNLLKAMKIENDVTCLLLKDELRGFEILKIEKHFPGTVPEGLLGQIKTKQDRQKTFAWNNSHGAPKLFIRPPMNPRLNLSKEIRTALMKKAAKKHDGKERTIVVLDNLTTHSEPDNFFQAVEELSSFINDLPFSAIWLYTGYYSDDDGYNCEFSLVPIKLSEKETKYLMKYGPK
ncbi:MULTISPECIES: hypothetical protein [Rhodobacterales]|uniref:hypothetical protein n=1 Tax=Rhodobacterales TaxID=204455 RepID=UPI0011BE3BDF|nr:MULTISPECIES: hypothetical protein [Rhodobacterales]MDO6591829.1 hypothetical protein [Yoonia sp. 1_MG-2023]